MSLSNNFDGNSEMKKLENILDKGSKVRVVGFNPKSSSSSSGSRSNPPSPSTDGRRSMPPSPSLSSAPIPEGRRSVPPSPSLSSTSADNRRSSMPPSPALSSMASPPAEHRRTSTPQSPSFSANTPTMSISAVPFLSAGLPPTRSRGSFTGQSTAPTSPNSIFYQINANSNPSAAASGSTTPPSSQLTVGSPRTALSTSVPQDFKYHIQQIRAFREQPWQDEPQPAETSPQGETSGSGAAAEVTAESNQKKKRNKPPPPGFDPQQFEKKGPTTKAERRELQEKQRAEKAARQAEEEKKKEVKKPVVAKQPVALQHDDEKKMAKHKKQQIVARQEVEAAKQVVLFGHLPQYERLKSPFLQVGFSAEEFHPAMIRLGLKYASGTISGCHARCVSLLEALREVFAEYRISPHKVLNQDLTQYLNRLVRFLVDCRPLSLAMGNIISFLKKRIGQLDPHLSQQQVRDSLVSLIDTCLKERLEYSVLAILELALPKIEENDVILTYAQSYVVEQLLKRAHDVGRRFRVIVVDSRPKLEGRELLGRLVSHGLSCSYVLLSGVSYVMSQVTKVLVGAAAILSNGTVQSRVGTAVLAVVAQCHNKPFLVACEMLKFSERVQLDAICSNELGDPEDLASVNRDEGNFLSDWRSTDNLRLLNMVYDLTPAKYVSMVISDVGIIPPTAVPVVIREYLKDLS